MNGQEQNLNLATVFRWLQFYLWIFVVVWRDQISPDNLDIEVYAALVPARHRTKYTSSQSFQAYGLLAER
jgi:hypothetical protein